MMMPDMDGLEVARRVRKLYGDNGPAILILSSAGHQTITKQEVKQLRVERVLMKPIKQSELLDAITRTFATATRDDVDAQKVAELPDNIRPMKLLLAEDGRVNQKVAIKLLQDRGHTVTLAEDGQYAVEAFKREPFDAILMDIQMPRMDGYEATGVIRTLEQLTGEHIPIIAMTANAMKGDREDCIDAGMDDYVAKPVRSRELFSVLEKYASSKTAAAEEIETADSGQAFDADAFRKFFGNDETMRELIAIFGDEADDSLNQARAALNDGDAAELQQAAHSLKGLVGNFSADPALRAASHLDQVARSGELERAGELLADCEREIIRLGKALKEFATGISET